MAVGGCLARNALTILSTWCCRSSFPLGISPREESCEAERDTLSLEASSSCQSVSSVSIVGEYAGGASSYPESGGNGCFSEATGTALPESMSSLACLSDTSSKVSSSNL